MDLYIYIYIKMEFSIVVASSLDHGIGYNNSLPWKIKTDLKFFRELTLGIVDGYSDFVHKIDLEFQRSTMGYRNLDLDLDINPRPKQNAIIMGRNTANGLKSPLKDRLNIVITSDPNYNQYYTQYNPDFMSFTSLDKALIHLKTLDINKVFVIGGSMLYDEAIKNSYCKKIYHTIIQDTYRCDTYLSDEFCSIKNMFELKRYDFRCEDSNTNLVGLEYVYHNTQEIQYLKLGSKILETGSSRSTRNSETIGLFGQTLEFDINSNPDFSYTIPVLTTKTVFIRGIIEELLFFLRGDTDTTKLMDVSVNIWKPNTNSEFLKSNNKLHLKEWEMGPMYGFEWRHFGAEYTGSDGSYLGQGVDQLANCVNLLATDPTSRRILMTSYDPSVAELGVLYPCHGIVTQFYVDGDRISLQTYQRSADYFLGLPFNITSYSILLCIIVKLVNNKLGYIKYKPHKMIIVLGDVHIYEDHIEAVRTQLDRIDQTYRFAKCRIRDVGLDDIGDLKADDIEIHDYAKHGKIEALMVA